MKKLIFLILVVLLTTSIIAQIPQAFKYQALARDSMGNMLTNHKVGLKISLLQGWSVVYCETHVDTTNQFGLINISIGKGTVVSGNFTAVDWGSSETFIQIELDATGGTNYQFMGTSQLLSVPYALHAKTTDFASNIPDQSKPIPLYFQGSIIYIHPQDNADSIEWGGYGLTTNANSFTDGESNTSTIVSLLGAGNYAAYLCDTLISYGFNDWYLPSIIELENIQKQSYYLNFNDFNNHYWSSTEESDTYTKTGLVTRLSTGATSKNSKRKCICIRK